MIRKLMYISLISTLLLVARSTFAGTYCQADFSYQVVDDISSYTYRFTNQSITSSSVISYNWSFGDGSGSKLENPEHQYLDQGKYCVRLTITTNDSCQSSFVDTIMVEKVIPPGCISYFTYIFIPQSVNYTYAFTDHSVSGNGDTISLWHWTFGDGSQSFLQNPIHQFQATGNYVVTLSITTKTNCQSSYSVQIQVTNGGVACQASFSVNPDTISNPLKHYFHDNSLFSTPITSWKWYFDDGDSSSLQDPTHTFPYAGIYYVRLKITTQGGCSDEVIYPITVSNPQPYNLWGRVYAGPYVIDKCIAYLYKEYNNNFYKPIDTVRLTSVNDTLGVYYFFQIPEGKHKVKVLLPDNSQYSNDYAPTYFGDDVKWNHGSTVNLFQDIAMANVHLEGITKTLGNCMISGSVNSTNSLMPQPKNIELLLYNALGEIVDYTFTDDLGYFEFNDISAGQYMIAGEVTGLWADMIPLNLTQNFDTIRNVVLNLSNKHITGFLKTSPILSTIDLNLYPNPASDELNVIVSTKHSVINLEIFDFKGMLIRTLEIKADNGSIKLDVSDLAQGMYMLHVVSSDGNFTGRAKIIKE